MEQYQEKQGVWECTKCRKVYVDRGETPLYCCKTLLRLHHEYTKQYKQTLEE